MSMERAVLAIAQERRLAPAAAGGRRCVFCRASVLEDGVSPITGLALFKSVGGGAGRPPLAQFRRPRPDPGQAAA
jgi:hypothetical protein